MSASSIARSLLALLQAPLICLTPLSDRAQQGVGVGTYQVHRRCQSSSRPVSHARDSAYFSRLKNCEHHSNQGTAPQNICLTVLFHLVLRFFGGRPMEPPVLPASRHNPIPSTPASILESCRRRLPSAAEMIAPLSGCDLFVSPIKLLSPHIVVKA